ncbi:MAG: tetratricopeptide repeat protein [Candidatus Beckwithbacteria bacterium]
MNWIKANKWQLVFLTGLVLITYGWTLNHAFLSDDIYGIVNNPQIFDFSWVWQNPLIVLGRFIYFSIAKMWGIVPWPYRLLNIMAHLLTVIGVMELTARLINRKVGLLAASLAAVHPIMIESVTWIAGGGHSIYGACLVWSLILYLKAEKKIKWLVISTVLFLAALQFSEKAAMFPGILLVYRLAVNRKRGRWLDLAPYILLSLIWLILNVRGIGSRLNYLETEYNSQNREAKNSVFIQTPVAIGNYLGLMVWPDKLTLYHSELIVGKSKFIIMAGVSLIYFGLTAWWLWQGFRGRKDLGLGGFLLAWLVIGLTPTLLPLGVAWIVAERYVYFGSLGIYILVAWGLIKWSQKPKHTEFAWTVIVLLVCLLWLRSVIRNSDWQDQDHLWLAAERTSPSSQQNHNNLGDLYGRRGDFKLAEWHFKRAIELNSSYADAMHNLANTYLQLNQPDEAIKWYQEALKNKPSLWQSHVQLGVIYYQLGQLDLAREELEKALQLQPENKQIKQMLEQM